MRGSAESTDRRVRAIVSGISDEPGKTG